MASSLTAWKFDTVDGAAKAEDMLISLSSQGLVQIEDAAVVEWELGKKKPKTRHLRHSNWKGAGKGGFWGLLLGLIFFTPGLGLAVGAVIGGLWAHSRDYGIKREFVEDVRTYVVPGTSALFLLISPISRETLFSEMKRLNLAATLIESNLTADEEKALREAFEE